MNEIDRLIEKAKAQLKAIDAGMEVHALMPEERKVVAKELPDAIKSLVTRKNKAFSEMNRLHAQLRWFGTDKDRLEAGMKILALEREIQLCWKAIDRYEATGELVDVFEKVRQSKFKGFAPENHTAEELIKIAHTAYYKKNRFNKEGNQRFADLAEKRYRTIVDYIEKHLPHKS